jgi:hypothetical protein
MAQLPDLPPPEMRPPHASIATARRGSPPSASSTRPRRSFRRSTARPDASAP